MIGHLGSRVSALLDGQLSAAEEERAWDHIHTCLDCRQAVEHEGWVKTRLAGLSFGSPTAAPDTLKGSLLGAQAVPWEVPAEHRNVFAVAMVGTGAFGLMVAGMIALGAAPASAPTPDRRPAGGFNVQPAYGPHLPRPTPARQGSDLTGSATLARIGW